MEERVFMVKWLCGQVVEWVVVEWLLKVDWFHGCMVGG